MSLKNTKIPKFVKDFGDGCGTVEYDDGDGCYYGNGNRLGYGNRNGDGGGNGSNMYPTVLIQYWR